MQCFSDLEALRAHTTSSGSGFLVIAHRNCANYPGMVLCIMLVWDVPKASYKLDLQWMSFGLDHYGDTLQESYEYAFASLNALCSYLEQRYQIAPSAIPIRYSIDQSKYPSAINNAEHKSAYEAAWERFQVDFKNGLLLDPNQTLVYSSVDS